MTRYNDSRNLRRQCAFGEEGYDVPHVLPGQETGTEPVGAGGHEGFYVRARLRDY